MMTMINDGLLREETTSDREREGGQRKKRGTEKNHTQTRVECDIGFWELYPTGDHRWVGRGKALRISRALGRPRSIPGRQGLEGTLNDAGCLE